MVGPLKFGSWNIVYVSKCYCANGQIIFGLCHMRPSGRTQTLVMVVITASVTSPCVGCRMVSVLATASGGSRGWPRSSPAMLRSITSLLLASVNVGQTNRRAMCQPVHPHLVTRERGVMYCTECCKLLTEYSDGKFNSQNKRP